MQEEVVERVKVVDAPCGKGKTSWAIQFMNDNPDRKFIFITPFLEEVDRIKSECKDRQFRSPQDAKGTKSKDFKRLLVNGDNVVATHSLFKASDSETIELIRIGRYTLILDEVMDVVEQVLIKKGDIDDMLKLGYIEIQEDGSVSAPNPEITEDRSWCRELVINASHGRLIYAQDAMLIWQFPAEIFKAFQETYILTYLFDGQVQRAYYEVHNIPFIYYSVDEYTERQYRLVPYKQSHDSDFKAELRELINLYQGPLNNVGYDRNALSVRWFTKKATPAVLKKMSNDLYKYFRHTVGGRSAENMWTCFKSHESKLKGNGYARGFIPHNARATNKYRDKKNLAYLVNRFPRTPISKYFAYHGVKMNDEVYALSELIQWVWRSRIRDGKEINLWIPSSRMRGLLGAWMGLPD